MLTITYIQAVTSHTQGTFNNHATPRSYRILVMATSVMGVMKMGNIVPTAGIEPTSLAFRASVLTITPHRIPDVTTIPTPTYLCSVRGQCSLAHIAKCGNVPICVEMFLDVSMFGSVVLYLCLCVSMWLCVYVNASTVTLHNMVLAVCMLLCVSIFLFGCSFMS